LTHYSTQYTQHPGGDLNPQSPGYKPRVLLAQSHGPAPFNFKAIFLPDTSFVNSLRGEPYLFLQLWHDESVGIV